jgi:hypothetical protein
MASKAKAHQRIDHLRKGSGPGMWLHLHRTRVADELHDRVEDPTKIDQGQVGLSGPAAFMQDLATDDPEAYARLAQELFEQGHAHLFRAANRRAGAKFINPDEDLRTYPIPFDPAGKDTYIPEADWLVLASLRQAYDHWSWWNWEHFYQALPTEGGTYAKDIEQLFKDTGYTKVINSTGESHWHNQNSATQASQYVAQGYRVYLQINADLLVPMAPFSGKDELNHAVGLISPITVGPPSAVGPPRAVGPSSAVGPSTVQFKIFTWGKALTIPLRQADRHAPPLDKSGNMTWPTFLQFFFGFIAAKY